jgi:hypothetical protein
MAARQVRRFTISQAAAVITTMVTSITVMIIRNNDQGRNIVKWNHRAAQQFSKAPQKLTETFAAALACRAYRECPEV